MTMKEYPDDKLLNEQYEFYADVFNKKYKNKTMQKDIAYAFALHEESYNNKLGVWRSVLKKVCVEIEKQMHPYMKKSTNHYVEINEERLRLQDPVISMLIAIKHDIEDRYFCR